MTEPTRVYQWVCHGLKKGEECGKVNPICKVKCYRCGSDRATCGTDYVDDAGSEPNETWDCCNCRHGNAEDETECDHCTHDRCSTCKLRGPRGPDVHLWICDNEKRKNILCGEFNTVEYTECKKCGGPAVNSHPWTTHRYTRSSRVDTWQCSNCAGRNIEEDKVCGYCPHFRCDECYEPDRSITGSYCGSDLGSDAGTDLGSVAYSDAAENCPKESIEDGSALFGRECSQLKKGFPCQQRNWEPAENCDRCGNSRQGRDIFLVDRCPEHTFVWVCCVCDGGNNGEALDEECEYCPNHRCDACLPGLRGNSICLSRR
ncbi:uncharacterized protein LY89DRAFT_777990 [Mollisia scopiformis]|uniref:RanBP2-type domain-containing protein n=1 Tax=Mollisia scopiformis TaxID=149040 RepID=A0A194XN37_MOLSC|nr:uncharacterized protein LY89DRAFT_777990 [Mollisia scopiformis]KUJ21573.1 hypothetical protein LY89DRAFT_777990 [Mollisia scopiformis]